MVVVVPEKITFRESGVVYITGSSNTNKAPDGTGEDELLCIALALSDHVTCTALFQVCNPRIFRVSETRSNKLISSR